MSILLFIVILAVLILIHEFGHFFAAKKFGVRVDEFGLGFPPRIWGKKIGETTYSLNAIPFGGFVKIFGENPDEDSIEGPDKGRSFVHLAKWKQIVVLASGVAMNVVFAWILFSIAYVSGMTTIVSGSDSRYVEDSHVVVLDVLKDSPAAEVGIISGDRLETYVFAGATTTITSVTSIQEVIAQSEGKSVMFEVKREGDTKFVTVVPKQGIAGDKYAIGISMDLAGKVVLPVHKAVWEGAKLTGNIFVGIAVNLYSLVRDAVTGHPDFSQVSGPIGIAQLVGDAGRLGIIYLFSFTAFISLNLAVLNLIPFPALDGGRILFVLIEAVRRKTMKPVVANTVNAIGFGLLVLLMIVVTVKDVLKLF